MPKQVVITVSVPDDFPEDLLENAVENSILETMWDISEFTIDVESWLV